jgi:DNA replication ATP-dependent helicase Dna2
MQSLSYYFLKGYSESMLKRLADRHPSAVAQLTLQYRMHEDISLLSNLLVYNGHLKCGNDIVRSKQISLPQYPRSLRTIIQPSIKGLGWLLPVLNPNKTVVFVNTDKLGSNLEASGRGRNSKNGSGLINDTEMLLSSCIVHGLLICGLGASSIGIIR